MIKNLKKYCFFAVVLSVLLLFSGCARKDGKSGLDVYFPSLGQGDCAVFVTGSGKTVIVDAGPAGSADDLRAFLLKEKIRTVDLLILTHCHADHVGGAAVIFDECKVGSVWFTPDGSGGYTEEELVDAIGKSGADHSDAAVGNSASFDGLSVSVILRSTDASDPNENCPVVRVTFEETSFLLMADAGEEAEKLLLKEDPALLTSNLLKVGHHGSENGCTEEFLSAVSPEWAVVCAGDANVYAHPHRKCIEALENAGCKVVLTLNGTQRFHSDGRKVYRIE